MKGGTRVAATGVAMIQGTSAMDKPVEKPRGLARRHVVLLAIGGVGLLGTLALTPAILRWARADRAVDGKRLNIAPVVRGDLDRDISAQGRVVAALHPTLFSPVAGIVSLAVKAGTDVKKGQLLARIESPEAKSRLVQDRSTLLALESDLGRQEIAARQGALRSRQQIEILTKRLAAAQRALERAQELYDQGLLNRVDHERAKDEADIAALELASARQSLQLEGETLDYEVKNRRLQVARQQSVAQETERQVRELEVVAPFDGMVATVNVQDRDAVAANGPLMTVVNLSTFEVEFDAPENYATDLLPGTPAEILFEGRAHAGKVTAVSPEVRDSQVRGTVVFDGDHPAGLRQSQRVSVRILLERKPGVLKVTRGPFVESGGGRLAYVVEDGLATRREIELGAMSVSAVEVVRGLREGEQVVVSDTSIFQNARTVLIRK
jgi:HlyD family secretion protein